MGRVQYAYYQDMAAVAKAYGVGIVSIAEDVLQSRMGLIGCMFYGEDYRLPFTEALDQSTWLPVPKGTRFSLDSRYITEDVPIGCCGVISFAKVLGVETPVLVAMANMANVVMQTDYFKSGYSLKNFGLEGRSAEEILRYMREG